MMNMSEFSWSPFWFMGFGVLGITLLALLAILMLVLKGYALWTAAKRDEKGWFIALLIINTLGILELIYLYFVVKKWHKPDAGHTASTPSEKNSSGQA